MEQPPRARTFLDARRVGRPEMVLIGILVAAFVLRLAWVLIAAHEPSRVSDAQAYLAYGRSIAAGTGYSLYTPIGIIPDTPTAIHPVGYPATLGALFWLAGRLGIDDSAKLAGLANVIFGTATVALAYGIARSLFDRITACVAASLVAFWPNLIFYTASALSETLFAFLLMLATWVAVAETWPDHLSRGRAIAFGTVIGVSILVRPFSALLIPAFLVVALASGIEWRRVLRFTAWAALLAAVCVAPWTIRNAVQMHAFIPVASNVGGLLCIDNSPGATGTFRWQREGYCANGIDAKSSVRREVVDNEVKTRRALRWMFEHPTTVLSLLPLRLYYGYVNDRDGIVQATVQNPKHPPLGARNSRILATVADAYFFAALAIALAGLPWFFHRSMPRRLFTAAAALALLATPVYTYGLVRFHVPALPLAAVLAAPALTAIIRAAWHQRTLTQPAA